MAQPLRTNVRFTPSEGITRLVPSREARVYDSGVGPVPFARRDAALLRCYSGCGVHAWRAASLTVFVRGGTGTITGITTINIIAADLAGESALWRAV